MTSKKKKKGGSSPHFHTLPPSILSFPPPLLQLIFPFFPSPFSIVFRAALFPFLLLYPLLPFFPLPSLFPHFPLPSKIPPKTFQVWVTRPPLVTPLKVWLCRGLCYWSVEIGVLPVSSPPPCHWKQVFYLSLPSHRYTREIPESAPSLSQHGDPIGGIQVFLTIKITMIRQGLSQKINMGETRLAREDRGCILFAFVSACVVCKNPNTPNLSPMVDDAIILGSIRGLGSPLYIWAPSLSRSQMVVKFWLNRLDIATVTEGCEKQKRKLTH